MSNDKLVSPGRTQNWVAIVIAILSVVVTLSALFGCKTCEPQIVYEPVEIKVPVQVPPPPIEVQAPPVWESKSGYDGDYLEYIKAVTRDLLNAWAYIEELRWNIDIHNQAIGEDVE